MRLSESRSRTWIRQVTIAKFCKRKRLCRQIHLPAADNLIDPGQPGTVICSAGFGRVCLLGGRIDLDRAVTPQPGQRRNAPFENWISLVATALGPHSYLRAAMSDSWSLIAGPHLSGRVPHFDWHTSLR